MNRSEKAEILRLQSEGLGYKRIADVLGMPVNTVKSFCYRNLATLKQNACKQCGKEITQIPQRKKKSFCSDKCRMKWWNTHPEYIKRKSAIVVTCMCCGKEFQSYPKRNRKFCSRSCYAKFREKE